MHIMKFGLMVKRFLDSSEEKEPIYGNTYLPRKFKIGIAVPPSNDIDVYSQDIGLIAIVEQDELIGFNVTIGGGMGMTHGNTETYPQLGRLIGFIPKEKVVDVCEKYLQYNVIMVIVKIEKCTF